MFLQFQIIAGQCIRNPYNSPPYTNEINAANIAADAAATLYPTVPYSGVAYTSDIAYAGTGLNYGLTLADLAASRGGGLRIKSSSSIEPSGVTVQTDSMAIEGPLAVSGQIPFLGVVALEGPLPAGGTGAVAYGCGNGNIGIVSEGIDPVAVPCSASTYPSAPGYPGAPGYPTGLVPNNSFMGALY